MARRGHGEGSIYQRKDGRWVGELSLGYKDGERERKQIYGKSQKEVRDKLLSARNDQKAGIAPTDERQTVAQFFGRWLDDSVKGSVRPRTYETYEEKVRLHILPEIGRVRLAHLTPQHIAHLYTVALEEKKLSRKTVSLMHSIIHRALKQALRWGLVGRNAAVLVDAPRPERKEPTVLPFDQLPRFLSAIIGHRHKSLWTILLATGMRFGEAAALRWQDVNLHDGTVRVTRTLTRPRGGGWFLSEPKTAKSRRIIPLPRTAIESLRWQRMRVIEARLLAGSKWQEHDFVFPSRNGTPVREAHVLVEFHRALEGAGLSRYRMHDLRHTFATQLFARNQHPRAVQELLGHSRIDMTMNVYTGSVPAMLKDAADSLETMFQSLESDHQEETGT